MVHKIQVPSVVSRVLQFCDFLYIDIQNIQGRHCLLVAFTLKESIEIERLLLGGCKILNMISI